MFPTVENSLHLRDELLLFGHIEDVARGKNVVGEPSQRVLRRYGVLIGTEDDADGRVIVRVVYFGGIIVEIEIDLPGSFGRQFGRLEFDEDVGAQYLIVEHHVHIVMGIVDRDALLRADEHEPAAKL